MLTKIPPICRNFRYLPKMEKFFPKFQFLAHTNFNFTNENVIFMFSKSVSVQILNRVCGWATFLIIIFLVFSLLLINDYLSQNNTDEKDDVQRKALEYIAIHTHTKCRKDTPEYDEWFLLGGLISIKLINSSLLLKTL